MALALSQMLSAAHAGLPFNKCEINGTIQYQELPCPSSEVRRQPTVEEFNAARQKRLAQEKAAAKVPQPSERSVAPADPFGSSTAARSLQASQAFQCDGRKYCSQMHSCEEAKYFLAHCPDVKIDGDHDGIPCEEQLCGH